MRQNTFILFFLLSSFISNGQNTLKGIAVEKTSTPIPYCTVSVKGTNISATTNKCGEFELLIGREKFTLVFSCMATQDFITFEKRFNPTESTEGETVIFKLKKHSKLVDNDCKKLIGKKLKKIKVY